MSVSETSRKAVFQPRARMLSLLGEQLISDQAVGLIELVKNAYDADATTVTIELSGLHDKETTNVLVRDNGSGMTIDDIEQKWLSPAVSYKERQKKNRQRTRLGRLPIGEKGVGRFAAHQLGRKLQLITHASRALEIVVDIDWDDFDQEDAYLNDIAISLSEREPQIFRGNSTGTMLIIKHARTLWTETLVAKIQRALRRLQSPHPGRNKPDFSITFVCPDFPAYQNIASTDILDRAHYFFEGVITEEGILDYEYHCRHPAVPRHDDGKQDYSLVPAALPEMHAPIPSCGPLYLNFYVWDRTQNYLQKSQISRADLDAMAGISIFRDGLRILPYGESGNDWLDLDKERINSMSERIGNQQIIGYVEIFQEETLALRDKTNREGLIENEAFRDMRALVRAAINVFISHWLRDRPKASKQTKENAPVESAKDALEKARDLARKVVNETSDRSQPAAETTPTPTEQSEQQTCQTVQTTVFTGARPSSASDTPGEPSQPTNQFIQSALQNHALSAVEKAPEPGSSPEQPASVTSLFQHQELLQLLNLLNEAVSYQQMNEANNEQQQQMLMHLAATGMAAERVAHEFTRQVNAALVLLGDLRTASRGNAAALRMISLLDTCIETLRSESRVLAPYDAGFRLQRIRLMKILEPIQTAAILNKEALDTTAISLEIQGEDFEVAGRPASLVQVFDNLIHNACFWLRHQSNTRHIRITLDPVTRTISVEDNGPGIPAHMYERIFQPFVSLRNGGRGLGLYITQELLSAMRASIELDKAYTSGARFIVRFPGSIVQSSLK